MSKSASLFAAAALLMGSAQAHMTLSSPQPFSPKPDNSPLSPQGTDYPCKLTGAGSLQVSSSTAATVDQPIQLSFSGSANHGGGSCQVSLSKDDASRLNTNSQFKVIYSIMGGCPGVNGANNAYSVKIPQEVPSGNYTMAWTWYNKVGNREIYMNCAPVSISGGSASNKDFSSLPDMAVYNIASKNDCHTTETHDVQFPNPGKYVLTGSGFNPAPPTGSCANGASAALPPNTNTGGGNVSPGTVNSGSSGSSYGSSSNAGGFDDGQYHPKGAGQGFSSPATSNAGSYNNGQYQPAASMKAAPTTLATSAAASSSTGKAPASPPPQNANGPPGGFIGAKPGQSPPGVALNQAAGQSCPTDGALVCNPDGTQFGLCNFGKVKFMSVAAGTKCVNGAIAGRRARRFLY